MKHFRRVGLVEKEGINRALLSFQNANIRLVLVDLSQATQNNFDEVTDNILLQNDGNNGDKFSASTIIVLNKLDVLSEQNENMQSIKSRFEKMGYTVCCISCKTGEGIDELLGLLTNTVRQLYAEMFPYISIFSLEFTLKIKLFPFLQALRQNHLKDH